MSHKDDITSKEKQDDVMLLSDVSARMEIAKWLDRDYRIIR